MARVMLSAGMPSCFGRCPTRRRREMVFGAPPPPPAAARNLRGSLVKSWPRLASVASFLRLIVAHLECPDILAALLLAPEYKKHRPRAIGKTGDSRANRAVYYSIRPGSLANLLGRGDSPSCRAGG